MGRELQKKKRRSGRMPVRQSNKTKKILNPRGNNIIADNWDKKATMSQNYRRLGLVSRLRAPTGGVEGRLDQTSVAALQAAHSAADAVSRNPFAIDTTEKAVITEARVERDASGKIIRVVRDDNPLKDPLRHLDEDDEDGDQVVTELDGGGYVKNRKSREEHEEWGGIVDVDEGTTDVVRELVEQARNPAPKKARHLSEREAEWLSRLVARHGDDTRAMARDPKLNPMQQTAADIARRLKKLNA
ncbi:nucleolar protein 16 [Cordyceps fumosorosea ARSEF 2679]|uniref:Nucleolar protein 16 n=1 Tax=Cordyceps fumosorosea (strain ARSEF 2679) TaxID=1081104 RepID=A0A168DF72_CORFA|nr:nucleolar protein 16 [Cordyceps fumosorosea ARSEF 2679]OAA72537.1 nucleolar protein 16 [Cordyceps fumosorosea ARSEF 2679]